LANAFTEFVKCDAVTNVSAALVQVGRRVEFVYYGDNRLINDPLTTTPTNNWRGEPGYIGSDDICVNLLTNDSQGITNAVGDDRDTIAEYTNEPGKFNHKFGADDVTDFDGVTGSSQNYVYVRVWDGDPANSGTLFGESILFTPTTQSDAPSLGEPKPPLGPPSQKTLSQIKCVLTRSKPAKISLSPVPQGLGAKTVENSGNYPKIKLFFSRSIGARWYEIQYRKDDDVNWLTMPNLENSAHKADIEVSPAEYIITLPATGDDANYSVRARARNDFPADDTDWATATGIYIPRTPDTVPPTAIIDLRVSSYENNLVTLAWSAPSDTDRYGNSGQSVASYDIRSAGQPLVDDSNLADSDLYEKWEDATSLTNSIYPQIPGNEESFLSTGITETTYFAIKSSDGAEFSPISNITGVAVGSNQLESTIELVSGLNFFALGIPPDSSGYPSFWRISSSAGGTANVATIQQFVDFLETEGAETSTFGYLTADRNIKGLIKKADETWDDSDYIGGDSLKETQGYQVYINNSLTLTVRNYEE